MNDDAQQAANALVAAAELVRKALLGDSGSHRLTNATRDPASPPQWATEEIASKPEIYGFADRKDRVEAGSTYAVQPAPARPPSPAEEREAAASGSTVSAFDRPSPVIVVGPKPLPVEGVAGGKAAPPAQPKEKPGAVSQAMGDLAGRLGFVIGPLTSLATVLNAGNSGLSVFMTAVRMLGATLAPVLLPAVSTLAAAVLIASDELGRDLVPKLTRFARFTVDVFLPAIQKVAEHAELAAVALAAVAAQRFAAGAAAAGGGKAGMGAAVGTAASQVGLGLAIGKAVEDASSQHTRFEETGFTLRNVANLAAESVSMMPGGKWAQKGIDDALAGLGFKGGTKAEEAAREEAKRGPMQSGTREQVQADIQKRRGSVDVTREEVLQSMLRSLGGNAEQGGLDVVNRAQLAAANQDPLTAKIFQKEVQSLRDELAAIAGNTARQPTSRFDENR